MGQSRAQRLAAKVAAAKQNKHLLGTDALAAALVNEFTDLAGVAIAIHNEYQDAPAGSLARIRCLGFIVDCIKASEKQSQGVDDLTTLTEPEIEAVLSGLLRTRKKNATEGTQTTDEEAKAGEITGDAGVLDA